MKPNPRVERDQFWTIVRRETNDQARYMLAVHLWFGNQEIETLLGKLWRDNAAEQDYSRHRH